MGELMRMDPMSLCLVKLLNLCLVIERLLEISLKLFEVLFCHYLMLMLV